MNKLTAKDLMIGDWVMYRGEPIIVYEIDDYYDRINTEPDGYNAITCVEISEITPIPITSKILEKNGFKNQTLNDPELINYVFKASFEHKTTLPNVEVLRVNYYDGVEWDFYALLGERESSDCGEQYEYIIIVKFVHELQRALRLCHINKEITL